MLHNHQNSRAKSSIKSGVRQFVKKQVKEALKKLPNSTVITLQIHLVRIKVQESQDRSKYHRLRCTKGATQLIRKFMHVEIFSADKFPC